MEARWISALVGGRARLSILRVSFSIFRVKVCRGGVKAVVASPRAIRSHRLQPHLAGNVERLVGGCGLRGFCLAVGIFGSLRSFIGNYSFFVSGTDVVFMTRSATSSLQPTTSGQLRKKRQRRRAVDTVWRLKMKGFSRISL
jgi:hypothetical protein